MWREAARFRPLRKRRILRNVQQARDNQQSYRELLTQADDWITQRARGRSRQLVVYEGDSISRRIAQPASAGMEATRSAPRPKR